MSATTQQRTIKVDPNSPKTASDSNITSEEVRDWIVSYLANLLEISPDEIEIDVSFDTYGLDSSAAIGLTGELEDWLGKEVDPTLLYDYPTVEALVEYLS
ncbi:MAG: acyl carrier protein [Cyanobacteria bacterium P01_A01_bin.116]